MERERPAAASFSAERDAGPYGDAVPNSTAWPDGIAAAQDDPRSSSTGVLARLERSGAVDRATTMLRRAAAPLERTGVLRDVLSGRPMGHPAHPAVVLAPLGTWLSASIVDLSGARHRPVARRLVGLGVLGAVPALASGASDWLDTDGAERRIGTVHALVNLVAAAVQAGSWAVRPRSPRSGVALSAGALALTGFGGWLGGHLAYRAGVGVNTTAFQSGPQTWTAVADCSALRGSGRHAVRVGSTAILLAEDDGLRALESRCTHRGGPLQDGDIDDGCVVCPWHGSRFALHDGSVRRGPATMAQPAYQTRVRDQRIELRRDEQGALRRNPQQTDAPRPETPG